MEDIKKENYKLMPLEEYKKLRNEAIDKLKDLNTDSENFCYVENQRVRAAEKDKLLSQLQEGYEYLEIPLELYFSSDFWRTLKVESNRRIRHLKMQNN